MRVLLIASVIAACLMLAACGNKGALYLPGAKSDAKAPASIAPPEEPPQRPVPAQSTPAPLQQ